MGPRIIGTRIAFVRLCSGKLTRGMKVKQVRSGKNPSACTLRNFSLPKIERLAEEGLRRRRSRHTQSRNAAPIGDTLTEGEDLNFEGRA